jgi:hypothetical protein
MQQLGNNPTTNSLDLSVKAKTCSIIGVRLFKYLKDADHGFAIETQLNKWLDIKQST